MTNYLVRFKIGKNNECTYPQSVAGVVWKSTLYHHTKLSMLGETDEDVHADGKIVVALSPAEARETVKEFRASCPELEDSSGVSDRLIRG